MTTGNVKVIVVKIVVSVVTGNKTKCKYQVMSVESFLIVMPWHEGRLYPFATHSHATRPHPYHPRYPMPCPKS